MGTSCHVLGCLLYQCSYEFLEKRLLARGKDSFSVNCLFNCRGRSDDNLDVIKRRFYSYEHETREVLDKLREKVGRDGEVLCSILFWRFAQSLRLKKRE